MMHNISQQWVFHICHLRGEQDFVVYNKYHLFHGESYNN